MRSFSPASTVPGRVPALQPTKPMRLQVGAGGAVAAASLGATAGEVDVDAVAPVRLAGQKLPWPRVAPALPVRSLCSSVVWSRAVTAQQAILTIVLALGGYLLGAIPFALLVARLSGVDIRRVGTRNMGAGNTFYQVSRKAGAVVMACDMAKGFLPALAAVLLLPPWPTALVALMPTLGHQYSVFLRGAGGKGIATAAGAELAVSPPVFVITMVLWVIALRVKRVAKLAPLVAGATFLASSFLLDVPQAYRVLAVAVCVSVLWAHRRELRPLQASA